MLEQYEGAIIESTTFTSQASDTVQAFYDDVAVSIDAVFLNQLNLGWSGVVVGVEDGFWQSNIETQNGFYGDAVPSIEPR